MSRSSSQRALARRALLEQAPQVKRSRLRSSVAVVALSVMSVGGAGAGLAAGGSYSPVASTAQVEAAAAPAPSALSDQAASALDLRSVGTSRSVGRVALADDEDELPSLALPAEEAAEAAEAAAKREAQQRAEAKERAEAKKRAKERAEAKERAKAKERAEAKERAKAKERAAAKEREEARERKEARQRRAGEREEARERKEAQERTVARVARAAKEHRAARAKASSGQRDSDASLPVTSGYRIAARFGDTGSWARYHTGIDFSASVGTTIRAVTSGVVTHAGFGSMGWAGRYVTIRHGSGKSTLYAHMSSDSVSEGDHVDAGDRIGAIGMTGRTFGPHLHFELYPAGVRPSNPYDAVDPEPWLRRLGLHI